MVRGVFDEIGLYDTIIGGNGAKQLWLEVSLWNMIQSNSIEQHI